MHVVVLLALAWLLAGCVFTVQGPAEPCCCTMSASEDGEEIAECG